MAAVFISYRRDDSKGFAGALARDLGARFGADQVFMDAEDIVGGTDFPTVLREAVASCVVQLVLIGPRWLDARHADGRRRLDDTADFVRQEVQQALASGARVIPVLLDGAPMPAAERLPQPLAALARSHALTLSNTHWAEDVARLSDHVREAIYARGTASAAGTPVARDFLPTLPLTRFVRNLVIFSIGAGLVFAGVTAALALRESRFAATALRAQGEVVALRADGSGYRPEVRYTDAAGQVQQFLAGTSSDPPGYAVGEPVPVLYAPADPRTARIDSFVQRWLLPAIFGGFALLWLGIGLAPLAWRALQRRRHRWLLAHGRPIVTSFHGVEQNAAITVQGRHPYTVVTEWRNPVSGALVQFRSHAVWDDPSEQAAKRMITVVVDPNQLRRYVMDLSFLGQAAAAPERL